MILYKMRQPRLDTFLVVLVFCCMHCIHEIQHYLWNWMMTLAFCMLFIVLYLFSKIMA